MLENLKQHRGPLGTYCGKFFFNSSKPFRRYGFPPCTQLFESRTVEDERYKQKNGKRQRVKQRSKIQKYA